MSWFLEKITLFANRVRIEEHKQMHKKQFNVTVCASGGGGNFESIIKSQEVVDYKINQAKSNDILGHLRNCNDYFIPPLNQKVDVDNYSRKIFENADTFEAWSENELIGLVAVYCNDIKAFITNVSVTEKYGNRGVASELLEMCIKHVESKQCKEIALEVNKQSEKARSLYKRFNFQEVEINDEIILMRYEI